MSKRKLALNAILVLLLLLPFAHAAVSEEQVQSVGGSSLTDAMPNSTRIRCRIRSPACWKT